jgi:RNA polymerase sigma factor (sigma-70 family)
MTAFDKESEVTALWERVGRIVRWMTPSRRQEQEDLQQEVFTALLTEVRAGKLTPESVPTIAVMRDVQDGIRRLERARRQGQLPEDGEGEVEAPRSEEGVQKATETLLLLSGRARLSGIEGRVLYLRFYQGLNASAASKAAGLTPEDFIVVFQRAIGKLRTQAEGMLREQEGMER